MARNQGFSVLRLNTVLAASTLLLAFSVPRASAVTSYYWDINGTTSGSGGPSPSGTWENADWNTSSSGRGTGPVNWVEGNFPRFSAGSDATGAYTITANSSHTITGMYNTTAGLTTIAGPGTMYISFSGSSGLAGFLVVDSLTVSNVIADSGGSCEIETECQGGASLYLNGANTYSGGTLLGNLSSSTGSVYFNNNSSFGTGFIQMSASGGTLAAEGTGAYTIANAVDMANVSITINGTPAGVTFSGPWDTGATGPCTMSIGSVVTISGTMSDSEPFTKSGSGILILKGNNSYGSAGGSTQVTSGTLVLANTAGSATGVSPIVLANSACTLTGSGTASGTVNNTGIISATNLSGGTATLTTGSQTWQLGSAYQWAINNVSGTAGATPGWDELVANGSVTINANGSNPMVIDVISLTSGNVQGALAAFTNTSDYSWQVLHSTTAPITGFSTSAVTLNSSGFANALGTGVFSVTTNNTTNGGDMFVNFVHAPVISVSNVFITAGSNAVFFASNSVPNSIPATATWTWKSNNVTMTDGGRISGSTTPTLTISNAQSTDSATYTVLASNPAGSAFVSATLNVTAASTSVSWTNPAPITYGTALDTTNELNATANVPGMFVYTPPAGMVLNAGTNTLTTVFTPTDTVDYATVTNTVSQIVLPVSLTVTASNASRPYGQANPTFTGSIVGIVNSDNISATYACGATPSTPPGSYPIVPTLVDPNNRATNYNVSIINGSLSIGTVVTWTNPSPITYGTALDTNQLNASASTSGTYVYTPAQGTVLNSGTSTLTVVFTPFDTVNYNSATNTVSLQVNPAPLVVTANNASRQSGITNPVFTGTLVTVVNGDNITATYSSTANSASAPGPYPIIPALVDPNSRATNYNVSLVNGTLTVTAPAPGISAAAPNIIPLPVLMQTNPGTFTLCPSQPVVSSPAFASMKILADAASIQTGQYLANALAKSTGYKFQLATNTSTNAVRNAILITTSNAISTSVIGTEGYELTVAPDSVVIRAPAQGGTFYGAQSLLQLLPPQIYSKSVVTNVPWIAPCVYIKDYPLYGWRGVMMDVARHFVNKQDVKTTLDAMAMHKLNVFHWHLVDDQGWRLEITNYPLLTSVGAWRNGSGSGTGGGMDYGLPQRASMETNASGYYGGFYTQADAREIVAYAGERHITVVPEIEMPCHSDAGLYCYPQFSCGDSGYTMDYYGIQSLYGHDLYSLGTPGTMTFLKDVLAEMIGVFPSKYIHFGGDEVSASGDRQWTTYSADITNFNAIFGRNPTSGSSSDVLLYQYWLSTNMAAYVASFGRTLIGWSEIESSSLGIVPGAAVMDWQTSGVGGTVAAAGLPAVMCPDNTCYINYVEGTSSNLKFDPPFVVGGAPGYLSLNTVYAFNPMPSGLSASAQSNILGAQCNLWAEYVPSFRNVMLKMFPRETAMAEITWTQLTQQNFASFTNRLVTEEQRFNNMGLNYDHETLPVVGTWGPTVSTSGETHYYDITSLVTQAGEVDINFWYGSGVLTVSSVALLVNGTQVDIDVHTGTVESSASYQASEPFIPIYTLYVLHLPELTPGATYQIKAVIAGSGSSSTSGTIYMPNWN